MIMDAREKEWSGLPLVRAFVDDKEVPLAWYADTEAGIVKAYVTVDGQYAQPCWVHNPDPRWEDIGGVYSETLHGVVRLEPAEPHSEIKSRPTKGSQSQSPQGELLTKIKEPRV